MKTVSQIKNELSRVRRINSPILQEWVHDPRKGVQQAVRSRRKQLIHYRNRRLAFHRRFKYENRLWQNGHQLIAGVDEVGRGPLAGPVVTCAMVLPRNFNLVMTNDSKQLTPRERTILYPQILSQAIDYGIGIGSRKLIDRINIYEADRLAMKRAILALSCHVSYIIVDAMQIDVSTPQLKLYHGDEKSVSVAAASIVAKVYRDHLMDKYDRIYPQYDFKHNAGYGTPKHLAALKKYGVTPIHRRSFAPVRRML